MCDYKNNHTKFCVLMKPLASGIEQIMSKNCEIIFILF